jgi:hypothetical protein
MTAVARVLAGLDETRPWREDLYRDLHQYPRTVLGGVVARSGKLDPVGFAILAICPGWAAA